jgi:hypothetical protein
MRETGEVRRDRRLCVRPFGRLKTVRCQIIGQAREALSPDNRWIAYASDESGRSEIYVRAFSQEGTGSERKSLVSGNGGYWPKWRRDGKELLYLDADRGIVGVQVAAWASFQHATPQPLFAIGNSHPGCSLRCDSRWPAFPHPCSAYSKPRACDSDHELDNGY